MECFKSKLALRLMSIFNLQPPPYCLVFHAVESSLGSFANISPRSSRVSLFLLKLLLSSVAYSVEDLRPVVRLSERRGSMMFTMDCIGC